MTSPQDWNQAVISEFRGSGGKVGGRFAGAPMLLMHTRGARTGREGVIPVMYLPDGDRWAVFASRGGAPTNPAWFHNLVANPEVTIEVGTETIQVRASIPSPEERDRLFARQVAAYPMFGEYQRRTSRTIPVVVFSRR